MHRIGLIIADHFQMLALSTLTVFEFANLVADRPFYQPLVYSEHGGTVRSSSGIGVDSAKLSAETQVDTWLVAGVLSPMKEPASPGVVHFLQTTARQTRRIAGICTAAFHKVWPRNIPLFNLKMIVFLLLMTLSGRQQV